jgi:subtilisin family serine protease
LSGAGVVIGIVDSGIDASHPAFRGRIHSIWDQLLPGPGAREGAIGAVLSGANLQSSIDESGHGTHVAGIAAGKHVRYGGVAPDATLVIVKTRRSTAQVAEGLRYVFRVAAELGRPAVVNLSLGGHGDAHDGSDPLSKAIDEETGPGRIVCAAAGNDGKEGIHARRTIEPGSTVGIRFRVPPSSAHIVVLNGWYAGTAALEFALRSPSDVQTEWQGTIASGDPLRTYETPRTRVNLVTRDSNPSNGDRSVRAELLAERAGEGVTPGVWQMFVRNAGSESARLDVWITDGGGQYAGFSGTSVDDTCLIGTPGAAARAITVGSYTTRVEWQDAKGGVHRIGLALDDISDFSSCGPLRNGAEKPDLVAPGAMIVSSRSATADSDPYVQVGVDCLVMQGTSMATPFVTGITALLLQRNPRMTPEEVKAELKRRCQIPGKPAGAYDGRWGFGLVRL